MEASFGTHGVKSSPLYLNSFRQWVCRCAAVLHIRKTAAVYIYVSFSAAFYFVPLRFLPLSVFPLSVSLPELLSRSYLVSFSGFYVTGSPSSELSCHIRFNLSVFWSINTVYIKSAVITTTTFIPSSHFVGFSLSSFFPSPLLLSRPLPLWGLLFPFSFTV